MRIKHHIGADAAHVTLTGNLTAPQCDCLRAFWAKHLTGNLNAIDLHLTDLDDVDGPSVAILVDLIRVHLDAAAEVTLHDPPQMLAHTLYKIGLLDHAALTLINPRRDEQPYA